MFRLLALWCLLPMFLTAQTPDTATLRGQVTDQTRAAVPMVRVTATNTLTGLRREASTDDSCNYSMAGLPVVSYGAVRRQTWFEIDGANGNDSWGRQTLFSNLPLGAVEEMSVLNNGFSAEYGASTGSAVNIVTRSGGSKFHGEFLELWRPSATAAALAGFTAADGASGNGIVNDALGQRRLCVSGPVGAKARFFVL